jgi:mRNA interferase RelE/StbE
VASSDYRILIKPSAVKELEAIPVKKDRQHLAARIGDLAADPRPRGCEKLTAQERYRVRQGRYRIVYSLDDEERVLTVVKIGHRKDVYR